MVGLFYRVTIHSTNTAKEHGKAKWENDSNSLYRASLHQTNGSRRGLVLDVYHDGHIAAASRRIDHTAWMPLTT